MSMREVYILGVKVNMGLSMNDVVNVVQRWLKEDKVRYVCTTNPEFIIEAQHNERFKAIINNSDLSVPDGIGVLFADAYIQRVKELSNSMLYPIKSFLYGVWMGFSGIFRLHGVGERIAGVDLVDRLCKLSNENGYSVFLLGGRVKDTNGSPYNVNEAPADLADKTAEILKQKYPNINIVGSTSQYSYKDCDDISTLDYIHQCMKSHSIEHIDLLFVAYGHFKQEDWIVRNSHKLPAKVSIGVGGTFDYISYYRRRCPDILIKFKLEWLFRLLYEKWRLRRIFNAFPVFPLKVYVNSLKNSK